MNMNYIIRLQYLEVFRLNVQISGRKYIFTIFAYELSKVKVTNCKKYRKYKYLGQNTSKYCSQIIVVPVHANDFF